MNRQTVSRVRKFYRKAMANAACGHYPTSYLSTNTKRWLDRMASCSARGEHDAIEQALALRERRITGH